LEEQGIRQEGWPPEEGKKATSQRERVISGSRVGVQYRKQKKKEKRGATSEKKEHHKPEKVPEKTMRGRADHERGNRTEKGSRSWVDKKKNEWSSKRRRVVQGR